MVRPSFSSPPLPLPLQLPPAPLPCAGRTMAGFFSLAFAALLAACGGDGGAGGDAAPPPASPSPPPAAGPSDAQRALAASTTAEGAGNACATVRPFYWEIGDASAAKASGSANAGGGTVYTAGTNMAIASATKWLYAAYLAERRSGAFTAADIQFLNFRSGYNSFAFCLPGQTVDTCLAAGNNGLVTAAEQGKFSYGGGHMQKHASLNGLGALGNVALADELRTRLGSDVALSFNQPQPAGGAATTAADYARVLRKMLNGQLRLGAQLGTQAVCTNPLTCAQALSTPIPTTESWHYSLGHWVEDDPAVGDGAFSSPGAFGFYPWIDAGKTTYGVLARQVSAGAIESVTCGRLIRKAWMTGAAQ